MSETPPARGARPAAPPGLRHFLRCPAQAAASPLSTAARCQTPAWPVRPESLPAMLRHRRGQQECAERWQTGVGSTHPRPPRPQIPAPPPLGEVNPPRQESAASPAVQRAANGVILTVGSRTPAFAPFTHMDGVVGGGRLALAPGLPPVCCRCWEPSAAPNAPSQTSQLSLVSNRQHPSIPEPAPALLGLGPGIRGTATPPPTHNPTPRPWGAGTAPAWARLLPASAGKGECLWQGSAVSLLLAAREGPPSRALGRTRATRAVRKAAGTVPGSGAKPSWGHASKRSRALAKVKT